ncbi:MAG: sigma-70 family RNA polymerase sigma factor [Polyangiaceae bacterium]
MKSRTSSHGIGRAHLALVPAREGEVGAQPSSQPEPELQPSMGAPDPMIDPLAHAKRVGDRVVLSAGLSTLTDAQLVHLARSGDRRAPEMLYRRHVAFAIHLATRIEGSTRDVEDIVHDAFIKAFTHIHDLAEPNAFKSWLGSIVVFAVRTRLRRLRLMNMLGLGRGADPVDLDSIASHDASPHTRAQLAQIYALLRTLPTDERIAWTLRAVEGHELEVVARLTKCSLATVKRRISRAQRFLEEHFVTAPEDAASNAGAGEPGADDAPTSSTLPSLPSKIAPRFRASK